MGFRVGYRQGHHPNGLPARGNWKFWSIVTPHHRPYLPPATRFPAYRAGIGIGKNLVRLSVGVENARDIIWDIEQALERV